MKKVAKIILLISICFLAICQKNSNVYAYTLNDVVRIVNFTLVDETLDEDEYDVEIDAEDMIDDEKLPVIQTSIEDVLYGSSGLIDINFLTTDSSNSNESWQFIQSIVQNVFSVTTYIGAAAMLTLLIAVAVMLVMDSISVIPDTPERNLKNRRFVQQWFTSVIMLALMAVAINLIVYFSENITTIVSNYKVDEDNIIIYVKNSEVSDTTCIQSALEAIDNLCWPVDTGSISKHFDNSSSSISGKSARHLGIDISVNVGTTVHATAKGTVIVAEYDEDDGYVVKIDHGNGYVSIYEHNSSIEVSVGDTVTQGQTIALSGNTGKSNSPHLHFQIEKNGTAVDPENFSYDNAPTDIGGTETMSETTTSYSSETLGAGTIDYYFSTNLEGLLMFQTQYDWSEYAVRNVINMIGGVIVTIFKILLYILFLIRMAVIAVLVMVAPIIVLINAFMKINGRDGILKGWFKLFMYFALLKPAIGLVYYMLASSNVYLISEMPLYILFPIAVIVILFIMSVRMMMKKSGKSKKPKKKGFSMI